jgi:hypothetical protein
MSQKMNHYYAAGATGACKRSVHTHIARTLWLLPDLASRFLGQNVVQEQLTFATVESTVLTSPRHQATYECYQGCRRSYKRSPNPEVHLPQVAGNVQVHTDIAPGGDGLSFGDRRGITVLE